MEKNQKTLDYYKQLPYTLRFEPVRDSDGTAYWLAWYEELRGCKTEGKTEADAVANLHDLFDEYIVDEIESGIEIPEPEKRPDIIQQIWTTLYSSPAQGQNYEPTQRETENKLEYSEFSQ